MFASVLRRRVAVVAIIAVVGLSSATTAGAQAASGRHPHMGLEIVGENGADEFGSSVALSGNGTRIVVGARSNDDSAELAGHARVFEWSSGRWNQLGADLDGHASRDIYGRSVSISQDGNRVAIGGPGHGARFEEGEDAGHVQIFDWNGTEWTQVGLDINGPDQGEFSGMAIDLSADGNRVLIGAIGWQLESAGSARVYEWNGTVWTQLGQTLVGEALVDNFGEGAAISADGQRIIVGARYNTNVDGGETSGHARVFEWDGTNWTQLGTDIDSQFIQSGTGASVDITSDGGRVIVGSPTSPTGPGEDVPNWATGMARVFDWDGDDWVLVGAPLAGDFRSAQLGSDVSISGDGETIIVGASGRGSNEHGGYARIYEWNGNTWAKTPRSINGFIPENFFGERVSISLDGSTAAIGAPGTGDDPDRPMPGFVRVVRTEVVPLATCAGQTVTVDTSNGERPTDGSDVILGTGWSDWIDAGAGDDIICALLGDDLILGGDGNDEVYGAAGNDLLIGDAGNDLLVGGLGDDRIGGGDGNDRIRGGHGDDELFGDAGRDTIRGGYGNDRLEGGADNDRMWGNVGRDVMFGEAGDDVLRGGAWRDTMNGGAGEQDGCTINDPTGLVETRTLCETGVYNR